ncbi:hypothetical protein HDU93_000022 [Gonapodya sp. JEL0774]|nr:hypothetical protein HDU93_000022 [Gonapodya sp. JEL0774]
MTTTDNQELIEFATLVYESQYSTSSTAHEEAIKYYSDEAVFSDPLALVNGKADGAVWQGVAVFPTYCPPGDPSPIPVTDPARKFVIVHATTSFSTSLGITVPIRTFTQFEFRKVKGRGWIVMRHEDTRTMGDLLPLTAMKTLNEWWRGFFGKTSSAWLRRIGVAAQLGNEAVVENGAREKGKGGETPVRGNGAGSA